MLQAMVSQNCDIRLLYALCLVVCCQQVSEMVSSSRIYRITCTRCIRINHNKNESIIRYELTTGCYEIAQYEVR